jgi:cytochrome c-type biogenesis protein CcmH/NrfG/4-amino-4-deoxy-L-arabinose transferase-like glycosyltransferase
LPEVSRWDRNLLFAVFLVALVIRIAYLIDISDSPYLDYPVLDSFWYEAKAKDVLTGDLLASSGSFRVPLYTYFIAGCYLVFGQGALAPLVIQAILGAVACGLVYLTGLKIFGRLAGAVAGFALAFYRMGIYSDGEILPTSLFIVFILAAVYFTLEVLDTQRLTRGFLAGLFLGLAFLTRPDVLPFALLLLLVVIITLKVRRGLRTAVSICVPLLALMLLLGYRNYLAFGEFHVFSPQGAVNLYIGNAGYADGKTPVGPPTKYPYHITTDPSEDSITLACKQAATEHVGRELSDRELSSYYLRKTAAEIGQDPARWVRLILKKTYYFLNTYERSDIKLIPRFVRDHSSILKLPLLTYGVVMPLGLVGLWLAAKGRTRLTWIVIAGVAAFTLNGVLFFVIWRYRLPAVPFLMILAGHTVSCAWQAFRTRTVRLLLLILAVSVGLGLLSVSRLWGVRDETGEIQYIINEGAIFMKAGMPDRAIELYHEAIALEPGSPQAYFYLGKALATQGLIDESKEMMSKAIAISSSYRPFAHMTLGVALAEKGDFEAAAHEFKMALDADSELGLAAYNLGLCAMNLGDSETAEKAFTRAEFLCKDDRGVLLGIAIAFIRMGKHDRGLLMAQGLLRDDPRNPEVLYAAGLGLETAGRIGEAIAHYERALRYMPASREIQAKLRDLKERQSLR